MQRDGAPNNKIDDRIRDIGEIPEHTKGLANLQLSIRRTER